MAQFFELKRADDQTAEPRLGRWREYDHPEESFGKVVEITCPICSRTSTLWAVTGGHKIAANGVVDPSIVCPNDECSFHVWGKLTDWENGERAKVVRET